MMSRKNIMNLLYDAGTFRKRYYKDIKIIPAVWQLPLHFCRHTYVTRLQAKSVPPISQRNKIRMPHVYLVGQLGMEPQLDAAA